MKRIQLQQICVLLFLLCSGFIKTQAQMTASCVYSSCDSSEEICGSSPVYLTTVGVTMSDGYTGMVTVSLSGAPSGMTFHSIQSADIGPTFPDDFNHLYISVDGSFVPGTYTFDAVFTRTDGVNSTITMTHTTTQGVSCDDSEACNYSPGGLCYGTDDCIYPDPGFDCDGNAQMVASCYYGSCYANEEICGDSPVYLATAGLEMGDDYTGPVTITLSGAPSGMTFNSSQSYEVGPTYPDDFNHLYVDVDETFVPGYYDFDIVFTRPDGMSASIPVTHSTTQGIACDDSEACNYSPGGLCYGTDDCIYPDAGFDCDGNVVLVASCYYGSCDYDDEICPGGPVYLTNAGFGEMPDGYTGPIAVSLSGAPAGMTYNPSQSYEIGPDFPDEFNHLYVDVDETFVAGSYTFDVVFTRADGESASITMTHTSSMGVACDDFEACNYNPNCYGTDDCIYPDAGFDCDGNALMMASCFYGTCDSDAEICGDAPVYLTTAGMDIGGNYSDIVNVSLSGEPMGMTFNAIHSDEIGPEYPDAFNNLYVDVDGTFVPGTYTFDIVFTRTDGASTSITLTHTTTLSVVCDDSNACNYNPDSCIGTEDCVYPGCMDSSACNYDASVICDDGSCDFISCAGCTEEGACNYDSAATISDDSCDYISCAGCMIENACNYDSTATIEDGTCEFTSCAGCMIENACNYDSTATIEDGTCEFTSCAGCTAENACNFDATATLDDDSCDYTTCAGCMAENACNYDSTATLSDDSCDYTSCAGCTAENACNYDSTATIGDDSCDYTSCAGCTAENACNYDSTATIGDDSCDYTSCAGCTAQNACNYDSAATIGDDSCDYTSCAGCTAENACNYDSAATIGDDSCEYASCAGCMAENACNYDSSATIHDDSCDYISCAGCTAENACNYDSTATLSDDSCEYASCAGCMAENACNYDSTATIHDDSCDYTSCVGCTYESATNYDADKTQDDGTCEFCAGDFNDDSLINSADLLAFLGLFGVGCQ